MNNVELHFKEELEQIKKSVLTNQEMLCRLYWLITHAHDVARYAYDVSLIIKIEVALGIITKEYAEQILIGYTNKDKNK